MSDSKILSSQEVGEIETASRSQWVKAALEYVPALCATVRHLLSENERVTRERNEALDQCAELHRQIAEQRQSGEKSDVFSAEYAALGHDERDT